LHQSGALYLAGWVIEEAAMLQNKKARNIRAGLFCNSGTD